MTKDNHEWPWLKKYPEKVDWYAEIKPRPVYEMLETTAKEFKWNWSEIENLVNKMAKGLQEQGVKKGVHVGVFLPNSPYFVIAYYAVLKAGGTVVNYNPLYVERELEYQIEDSETDIMITADLKLLYDKAHKLLHSSRLKKLVVCSFTDILPFPKNILFKLVKGKELAELEHPDDYVLFSDIIKNDGKPADPGIDPENDLAVLQYTGGTTGVPKGAMLTHYNVVSNVDQAVLWCYKTEFGIEKMVGVLPFFHVFAMTAVMNLSVRAGLEIIALPRFDLDQTLKLVDKYKPHFLPAVPAIYSAINNHKDLASFDLKSLRYCISGGAPLPVEVKKKFEANTGCVVSEGYGLTETAPIVCVNPIEGENKAGSIGLPMPQTIVELIDAETGEIVTKPGERGELCVRGPQVMKGYWNKPEDSASSIKDGRLHTGDVATMDEDGYVFIVDRIKDMIITNGYNVYPRYVEEAIYLHPNVEECIVAGVPDASRGEIVKAWIKPKEGRELSVEDMKDFLADKLSKIQIPRQFEIRNEALPKTMIGKLSRKDILKEEADKAA